GKPVVHWEIWAQDHKKMGEFYGNLFDWKVDFNNPMDYGVVDTGAGSGGPPNINGGIMKPKPGPIPASHLTFYVQVEDLQATLDKAVSLGGETVVPPTPIPGVGKMALFKDPEGNTIGLFSE
ncbi:MAG: VOC family protein, partial [Acidobacteriota bacterium]